MKNLFGVSVLLIFLAASAAAQAPGTYGAIAFSPSTGKSSTGTGFATQKEAEAYVLRMLESPDGRVVAVAFDAYMALAMGADRSVYGAGVAKTRNEAEAVALKECSKRTGNAKIVWSLYSHQGRDKDTYASIAYSPSTGKYGSSTGHKTRGDAEKQAIANCKAADARAVAWVQNGICALALGDDRASFGVGVGKTVQEATDAAVRECQKRTTNAKLAVWIGSGY